MFKSESLGAKKQCCAVKLHITAAYSYNLSPFLGLIPCFCQAYSHGDTAGHRLGQEPLGPRRSWAAAARCAVIISLEEHSLMSEWCQLQRTKALQYGTSIASMIYWYTVAGLSNLEHQMLDVQHSLLQVLNEEFSYFPTNGNWSWLATWHRTVFLEFRKLLHRCMRCRKLTSHTCPNYLNLTAKIADIWDVLCQWIWLYSHFQLIPSSIKNFTAHADPFNIF